MQSVRRRGTTRSRATAAVVAGATGLGILLVPTAALATSPAAVETPAVATIDPTPFTEFYVSNWGGDVADDTTAIDVTLPAHGPTFPELPLAWTVFDDDDLISQGSIAAGATSFVADVPVGSDGPTSLVVTDAGTDPAVSVRMNILLGDGPSPSLPTSVIDLSTQQGVHVDLWSYQPTEPVVTVGVDGDLVIQAPGPWFTDGTGPDWMDTALASVTVGQKGVPDGRTPLRYDVSADGTSLTVHGLAELPADAWAGEPAVEVALSSDVSVWQFLRATVVVPIRLADPAPVPTPDSTGAAAAADPTLAATGVEQGPFVAAALAALALAGVGGLLLLLRGRRRLGTR